MPDVRLAFQPFPAQEAYFRRKISMPSARWNDLRHGEHAHGFMVAGLTRLDVLDDIRKAVMAAISEGETLADFQKRFDAAVAGKWSGFTGDGSAKGRAWRTRIIYQTNLRTSYMAGRWQQLQAFPYLRYQHNTVNHPRVDHQAWNGRIIATADPWWDTHYPPNGWGCRCTVSGVSEARLRALRGDAGPDGAPGYSASDEPPPEWAYHVGKQSRSMAAAESFGQKVMALPPDWRKIALDDAQRRQVDWMADWAPQVERINAEILAGPGMQRPTGSGQPIGFLTDAEATGLVGRGIDVDNALIVAGEDTIYHALRTSKHHGEGRDRDLFVYEVMQIPSWRNSAGFVVSLLDTSNGPPKMLVIRRLADGRYMRMVVALNDRRRYSRSRITVNAVDTIELSELDVLKRLPVLDGEWK